MTTAKGLPKTQLMDSRALYDAWFEHKKAASERKAAATGALGKIECGYCMLVC